MPSFKNICCKDTGEIAKDYSTYLQTNHWKALRKKVYEKYNSECQRCHDSVTSESADVHHRSYKRLGNEKIEDLVLYCNKCHAVIHKERKADKEVKRYYESDKSSVVGLIIDSLKVMSKSDQYKVLAYIQRMETKS